MKQNYNSYVRMLAPHLILLTASLSVTLLSWQGVLPTASILMNRLLQLFTAYGVPIVAMCSFVENIPGISTYFPGSTVLLLAMASTSGDPKRAVLTYAGVLMPAIAANLSAYYLGRRSSGGSQGKHRSYRRMLFWYASTYWHPQLAALTAVASGSEGTPISLHLRCFLVTSIPWSIFWALVLYRTGAKVLTGVTEAPWVFYIYLLAWTAWTIGSHRQKRSAHPISP